MKKMKKIMAALLAMVMMLAMTTTAFAAGKLTSNITVKGLTQGVETTLKAYQAVSYDAEKNNWVVAEWAKDYITLNAEMEEYVITDAEGLGKAAQAQKETLSGTTADTEYTLSLIHI